MPTGRVVGIRGKQIRRKIGHNGIFLDFERAVPDRPEKSLKANQRVLAPVAVREALRLIWEADRYPILGNEDWRVAAILEAEALERAATAVPTPGDSPEFARWVATLRQPRLPNEAREEIMSALYDFFDPDRE